MKSLLCVCLLLLYVSPNFGQSPVKIMPLGNSITQGEGGSVANDGITHNTWRLKLWQRLVDTMGYDIDFIGTLNQAYPCEDFTDMGFDWDHEGHWAWTIDEILYGRTGTCNGTGRLGQWLDTTGAPDYILIHLGTNDCWGGQSVSSSVVELEILIDTLQVYNSNITILLAQIIGHATADVDACIQQLNDSIPVIATRHTTAESNILVINQYSGFDTSTDLYDAAHPNTLGEDKIFQKWFDALDPLLSGNTLPVELSNFQAKKMERGVHVSWSTASEIGTDVFVLERKESGGDFREIYQKRAIGGESSSTHYQYLDLTQPMHSEYIQYRLKIIDLDGTTAWSSIQSIYFEADQNIELWPTVLRSTGSILHIRTAADSHMQILDTQGKLYYSAYVPSQSGHINLPPLANGVYYARIRDASQIKTIPILVL